MLFRGQIILIIFYISIWDLKSPSPHIFFQACLFLTLDSKAQNSEIDSEDQIPEQVSVAWQLLIVIELSRGRLYCCLDYELALRHS